MARNIPGWVALILIALALAPTAATGGGDPKVAVQLLQIDEDSPGADARKQRLAARLDQTLKQPYVLAKVTADISSLESLRSVLQTIPDQRGLIVLAGSGLMAQAAVERFSEATILFATQHDLWELGLLPGRLHNSDSITGFTYDANVVPQVLSILKRSNVTVHNVAILADEYLSAAWSQRARQMQVAYRDYRFRVFSIDSDADLEKCFARRDVDDIDVWILLSTVTFLEHSARIRAELEKRRKIGVYPNRPDVDAGGLMSYETSIPDPYGIWARQIALLAAGVPARQIPMERPSNFELTLNLSAARRIGLRFPATVVKSASSVVWDRLPDR